MGEGPENGGARFKYLLQVVLYKINIICHQLTPISLIQNSSFARFEIQTICVNLHISETKSAMLGLRVTKYVDLTKKNLY